MSFYQNVINVYKPISYSPFEVIKLLKSQNPELADVKIAYAGRLDPMAHGVLLLLLGDECKNRDHYQDLDKEYEFEVLFGVSTDTYDVLGKIIDTQEIDLDSGIDQKAKAYLEKITGVTTQTLPPYSSQPVDGKPLFQWAREGRLDEISLPTKQVQIDWIKHLDTHHLDTDEVLQNISSRINNQQGDFRQEEILQGWENHFSKLKSKNLLSMKFRAQVHTGTYIRSLVSDLGVKLGLPTLAYDILRTRVGEFHLDDSMKLS